MTLWELAQSMIHDFFDEEHGGVHRARDCGRCRLEAWTREKAKELIARADDVQCTATLELSDVLADLGVPDSELERK